MNLEAGAKSENISLEKIARLISNLTAPPMLATPLYVLLGFHDQARLEFSSTRLAGALGVAILTGIVLPVLYILFLRLNNRITGLLIPVREQRTIPYLVTIGCYLLGFGLIYSLTGPGTLAGIFLASALSGIIVTLINFYWKISAHATGVSGPLAVLTILYGWWALPFYCLIPLVDWARVYIKAHTLGQVIAGSIFGFGFTAALYLFVFRPLGWF